MDPLEADEAMDGVSDAHRQPGAAEGEIVEARAGRRHERIGIRDPYFHFENAAHRSRR